MQGIEKIAQVLGKIKDKCPEFGYEYAVRRKRESDYYKLFYKGEWFGEFWNEDNGRIWTNAVSNKDSAPVLGKGMTLNKFDTFGLDYDTFYLKLDKYGKPHETGFTYCLELSTHEKAYEIIMQMINFIDPEVEIRNNDAFSNINVASLPKRVIKNDTATMVLCPNCDYEFVKAPRCPECGQLIKYENEKWNKPKLANLDEWEKVSKISGASTKEIADFVREVVSKGFSYHVGAVDLMIDLSIGENEKPTNIMMFFGVGEAGGFQPKTLIDGLIQSNKDTNIADDFMEEMKPFLSMKQKNKPYERIEGYYYFDYATIINRRDEFMAVLMHLRDMIKTGKARD